MFNENFVKKSRTCRLPFPETWSLNSLLGQVLWTSIQNGCYLLWPGFSQKGEIPPIIENCSSAMSHWAILGKFAMQMMLIKFDWLVNDLHCKIFLRLSSWASESRFSVDCGQSKTDNYLMNRLDSMRGKFEAGRAILYKLWTTCEV